MAGYIKKCPCLRPKIAKEVRELDYRHCSLKDVPTEVFNFERTLEELYVDSNQIRELPKELFCCHGIRKLSFSDNEIAHIPPAISSLVNLEELDLSKNGIIDMPENIKCCKHLRHVDASVNPLGKLPDGFTQLLHLTQLFLNDSFLDYLPGNFGRLSHLKILEIRENHLKTLPKSFSRLTELERLDIGHNEFNELPDVIGNLTSLLELWCDQNQITTITPTIGALKQLMFLDASKNMILSIPSEIEGCTSLADLHLTCNNISHLPDSLGKLENITTLKIDGNQLNSLPETIGGLTALSEMNVSRNDLEELPASLGLLRNLRTLYADENHLTFIPPELGSCNGITVLSLRSNNLEYLPDEIGRIPRLRVLNLSDNRLQCLPFSVTRLKELQALWLSENQTRPIVKFQSDHDPETGRKILTCYLLPQVPGKDTGDSQTGGDNDSFHASMWDEERAQRQQIHFDFSEDYDQDGKLVRCPTPYPKEMREKIRHAQNLAMRQKVMGLTDASWSNPENIVLGAEGGAVESMDLAGSQSDVQMREAFISKPQSPSLQETHRLYICDKEKLARDKARMQQHRHSNPEGMSPEYSPSKLGRKLRRGSGDTNFSHKSDGSKKCREKSANMYEDEDDGGFGRTEQSPQQHKPTQISYNLGLNADPPASQSVGVTAKSSHFPEGSKIQGFSYVSAKDLTSSFANFGMITPHSDQQRSSSSGGKRTGRGREYDSDTGYKSETEVVRFNRQRVLSQHGYDKRGYESEKETQQKSKSKDGYSSDVEGYRERCRNFTYKDTPVEPIKNQNKSGSLPYDLNAHGHEELNPMVQSSSQVLRSDESYSHQNLHESASWTNIEKYSNPLSCDTPYSHPSPGAQKRTFNVGPSPHQDRKYPPPSPGQFHHFNMIDSSSPVNSNSPHVLNQSMGSRSRSNSASGSHENNQSFSDYKDNMEVNTVDCTRASPTITNSPLPVYKPPPSYKPAPPYGQRKLVSAPTRNQTQNVFQYDRRGNNSPLQQRMSELTIQEHSETHADYSDPRHANPAGTAYNHGPGGIGFHDRGSRNHNIQRSGSSSDHHDNSFSHEKDFCFNHQDDLRYNYSSDPSTMSISPDRSRTPQSGCFDDHRDSPRESGYSSREHSSQRNSPFDTPQKYNLHQQSSFEDSRNSPHRGMLFDDLNGFKDEPSSQVSTSTDSGYDQNLFDKMDITMKHNEPQPNPRNAQPSSQMVPYGTPSKKELPSSFKPGTPSGATQDRVCMNTRAPLPAQNTFSSLKGDQFLVTITKNPGLGFSIAGGNGSHGNPYRAGDKGIFVTKVHSEGPAAMSLKPGDKILSVNGRDFTNIDHEDAVNVMKNNKSVSMSIERVYTV